MVERTSMRNSAAGNVRLQERLMAERDSNEGFVFLDLRDAASDAPCLIKGTIKVRHNDVSGFDDACRPEDTNLENKGLDY